jgi:hypothetical protein
MRTIRTTPTMIHFLPVDQFKGFCGSCSQSSWSSCFGFSFSAGVEEMSFSECPEWDWNLSITVEAAMDWLSVPVLSAIVVNKSLEQKARWLATAKEPLSMYAYRPYADAIRGLSIPPAIPSTWSSGRCLCAMTSTSHCRCRSDFDCLIPSFQNICKG